MLHVLVVVIRKVTLDLCFTNFPIHVERYDVTREGVRVGCQGVDADPAHAQTVGTGEVGRGGQRLLPPDQPLEARPRGGCRSGYLGR